MTTETSSLNKNMGRGVSKAVLIYLCYDHCRLQKYETTKNCQKFSLGENKTMESQEPSNVDPPSDCIIPAGTKLLTSIPDVLMIPELVFGGLVWILVASIFVFDRDSQGWVIFVSLLLFVLTLLLLICYFSGWPRNSTAWCFLDACYHGFAALFYFSAAVLQANSTVRLQSANFKKQYQTDIAATVFAFAATVLYVAHAVFSFKRWKTI
ncbi:myelin and lymphocyte protein-like [Cetorhinus maximus]